MGSLRKIPRGQGEMVLHQIIITAGEFAVAPSYDEQVKADIIRDVSGGNVLDRGGRFGRLARQRNWLF